MRDGVGMLTTTKTEGIAAVSKYWILTCDGNARGFPFGFACARCGARHEMRPTVMLETYITFAQAFVDVHKECKQKASAA